MINLYSKVILKESIPDTELRSGRVGKVVHVYKDRTAFAVQFMNSKGRALVVTKEPEWFLPFQEVSNRVSPGRPLQM